MAAKNYTEILALVNAGNQMGLSNTIKRDYGIPLDFTSVQPSYDAAVVYAAESTKAYVGQPLSVGGKLYIINDVAAAAKHTVDGKEYDNYLVEVGSATPGAEGDGVSIDLEEGVLTLHGFKGALAGYLPRKSEDGTLEWVPLSEVAQGDGNKITTLTSTDGSVTITKTTDTLASLVYDLSVKIPDNTTLIEALERKVDDYKIATDTELYGADLVNSWKGAAGSYAPDYSAATSRLDTLSIVLEGFGGEGQPATVLEAINSIKVELPKATTEGLGGIKASESIAVDENGVATVAKVSTDVLVQGNKEFVLNGGGANA